MREASRSYERRMRVDVYLQILATDYPEED